MSAPGDRDDSEWRKRITATLTAGGGMAIVDNLERPLGSPSLAALLTSETWTDRVLGRSEIVTLPARTVWAVTGNNVRLRGDLPRRTVWTRLDAQMAQPWTRESFRHADLAGWARANRGELLAAVYVLARCWLTGGRPGPGPVTPKLGSFESWREVVGGTLYAAGIPGFLGNLARVYAQADEDTPQWAGFLAAWSAAYGAEPVTTARVAQDLTRQPPLLELLEALPGELAGALEDRPQGFTRRLGRALAQREDTRFVVDDDGRTLRIERAGSLARAVRWQVVEE